MTSAVNKLGPMRNHNTSVSLVIPTYNERENIRELLSRIHRSVGSLGAPYDIIVDDYSPDETWKVAAHCAGIYPIRVLRREGKRGLATAVLDGIKSSNYDIVVVMDADLQHPPETVSQLVATVNDGTDIAMAVGSSNPAP